MEDTRTDEQIARETIFGVPPQSQPQEQVETPEDVTPPSGDPQIPASEPAETPAPAEPDFTNIPDDKILGLLNTKFNVKFDTLEQANDFISNQKQFRGQEEIISQLAEKLKEKSNVLSHFPSENAYKVAYLAKEKYPQKEGVLTSIINSDVDNLPDLEAISLAEALNRPNGSKVNPLRYKLSLLGLKDLDVAEFNDWDEADKEIVYGAAEDARIALKGVQASVTVPKEGDPEITEMISQIERGVLEGRERNEKLIQVISPIAETMVKGLSKIKPVDGEDFEYAVTLDQESQKNLQEFVLAEAIEGQYNLQSDSDIRTLNNMLISEIWATDGPKILAAFGKYKEDKVWEQARRKYENAEPLNQQTPPSAGQKTVETDNDRARRLLGF